MTAPPLWEQLWARFSTTCVHHEPRVAVCKTGVVYKTVNSHGRSPCISMEGVSCAKFQAPTDEQVDKQVNEVIDAVQRMDCLDAEGRCVACGVEIKARKQVGRCVYAEPCGHRVGQGVA